VVENCHRSCCLAAGVALGAGVGFITKSFVWPTAQKFLAGAFRGTRSRPLTAPTCGRTPARLERGRYPETDKANEIVGVAKNEQADRKQNSVKFKFQS
jgi:hypothetical protein